MLKALARFSRKALASMTHAGGASVLVSLLPRTKYDYKRDLGEGTGSSVIMGPVQWLQRALIEAPVAVMRRKGEGEPEAVPGHPLVELLNRPNPFYSGAHLWAATVLSWCVSGNAYWVKVKSAAGRPAELWWVPPSTMAPKWPDGGKEFISRYEYNPGRGEVQKLEPADVVHFRHGIDPLNPRLGISPLHAVMREAWTDDEASNFVGAVLRNGGVPGVVLSPREGRALPLDAEAIKKYLIESFTGDRRAEPLVFSTPTDVSQFGWNPQQMDLSAVRDVAEERVCACLGIAAAVVGFGTGLQTTRVGATMREMVRLSWTCGVLPLQRALAAEVTRSLLPDFGGREGEWAAFDVRGAEALQEDLTARFQRAQIGVQGGFMRVDEAKRMVGLRPGPGDAIYLRSIAMVEVPAAGEGQKGMIAADAVPAQNGPGRPSPLRPSQAACGLGTQNRRGGVLWEGGAGVDRKAGAAGPAVQRALAQAPRRRPTRQALGSARALDALRGRLTEGFAARVAEWLEEVGEDAARAAAGVLQSKALEDEMDADAILNGMRWEDLLLSGKRRYDAHYSATARESFGALNSALGLQTDLPDPAALRVLAEGGRRFGLLDLRRSAREKLFTILTEGREEGLGAEALARRIRETAGAGPWSTPGIRARVVARTETLYAQNLSVAEYALAAGAPRVMVFDARLGPTDEECESLNGAIVSADEVPALAASEHPNGTRSFTPWFEED